MLRLHQMQCRPASSFVQEQPSIEASFSQLSGQLLRRRMCLRECRSRGAVAVAVSTTGTVVLLDVRRRISLVKRSVRVIFPAWRTRRTSSRNAPAIGIGSPRPGRTSG